jgi:hypothetical protein
MVAAARRLEGKLPPKVGDWSLRGTDKLEPLVQETLQCAGYFVHRYENVETGARINVFVVLGPHGPISVHTPEICYSSRDHRQAGERQSVQIQDVKGNQHELWDLRFKATGLEGGDLRVLYAWSDGGIWQAAQRPRFQYAGAPYLYKIQLSGPIADSESGSDPCREFLEVFLAELGQRLAEPAATLPDRS